MGRDLPYFWGTGCSCVFLHGRLQEVQCAFAYLVHVRQFMLKVEKRYHTDVWSIGRCHNPSTICMYFPYLPSIMCPPFYPFPHLPREARGFFPFLLQCFSSSLHCLLHLFSPWSSYSRCYFYRIWLLGAPSIWSSSPSPTFPIPPAETNQAPLFLFLYRCFG